MLFMIKLRSSRFLGTVIYILLSWWGLAVDSEIRPLALQEPVSIDGRLDEPAWRLAPVVTDFVQFKPERGRVAAYATEVRVLLAADRLIVGFLCRDPEPERITARLTRRDSALTEDDCVCVGLDTFFDHRTAYYFFTNPLGTQEDGRLSENGRVGDATWDGEWRSAAVRIPEGWSAEIEIPLAILKYDPKKGNLLGHRPGKIDSARFGDGHMARAHRCFRHGLTIWRARRPRPRWPQEKSWK